MNTPIWIVWIIVGLLAVLSSLLLMGKGAFLIAGYNTSSKEQKANYNAKMLCRIIGGGLSVITIFIGIATAYQFQLLLVLAHNVQLLTGLPVPELLYIMSIAI